MEQVGNAAVSALVKSTVGANGAKKMRGRPPGVANKITRSVRENIVNVFEVRGGWRKMMLWADENETEFYRMYARLAPVEAHVSAPDGGPVQLAGTDVLLDAAQAHVRAVIEGAVRGAVETRLAADRSAGALIEGRPEAIETLPAPGDGATG